jgi:hypothetical protein
VLRSIFAWLRGKKGSELQLKLDPERQQAHDQLVKDALEKIKNRQPHQERLPKPTIVSDPNDPSPYVCVRYYPNGPVVWMDREALEYEHGESSAPDPAQRDLDDILLKTSRVRVVACGAYRGRALGTETLVDSTDIRTIQALRKILKIVEDPRTFGHCRCLGGPTLEMYAAEELLATIAVHHGKSIRWDKWKHDAQLQLATIGG